VRRRLRASWRAVAFVTVGLAFYPTLVLGRLALRRDSARRERFRARVFRRWCAAVVRLLGVRLTLEGKPPAAPCFLVCNHLGYLDIVVLASRLPAVFVAKAEVASWPVLGAICRAVETIFVDRASRRDVARVLERTRRAIDRGAGVVLFPEGTSSGGETVLPFLPALLETPAALALPVHYASLSYATLPPDPPAHEAVCWWRKMTFPGHLWRLFGLVEIHARLVFGPSPIVDGDRKRLAAALHRGVLAGLQPVVGLPTR
jgi:1-acyl-sn-glycerol-3-phosphate acyltransferase